MCGISGFLLNRINLPQQEAEARLTAMNCALQHRGPDDEGIYFDGAIGFGQRRLAVIDLSPLGHQPMHSADGRVTITYNGEIYNFPELRAELETLGHKFISHSDTEVIINGYLQWGREVFTRLRGMFAIALWDKAQQKILLARDRIGVKPLYYALTDQALLFGSEIKAILAWPEFARKPNHRAIDNYLSLQYVPAPMTAFEGVAKLSPASILTIDRAADGTLSAPKIEKYWQLPKPASGNPKQSLSSAKEELVERLREAVKIRMISDVPLGAFLSGGVDSSAIVALMSEFSTQPVKTFSIGFDRPDYDETKFARMVAQRYGTDHQEFIVQPNAMEILPKLVHHYGEPFADSSAIPTWYVSQLAREKVTVVLNGDGGDEAFYGYSRYAALHHLDKLKKFPALGRVIAAILQKIPTQHDRRNAWKRMAHLLMATNNPVEIQRIIMAYFNDDDKAAGYSGDYRAYLSDSAFSQFQPLFEASPSLSAGMNYADIHSYLPDDLLVKVDVATMAHGLEARSPFLDHKLMEWAVALPEHLKLRGMETKYVLKKSMESRLPREVLYRPKMGFQVPLAEWFRGSLKEMVHDVLLSTGSHVQETFSTDYLRRLLEQHTHHKANNQNKLWALLMLELWYQMWIDSGAKQTSRHLAA